MDELIHDLISSDGALSDCRCADAGACHIFDLIEIARCEFSCTCPDPPKAPQRSLAIKDVRDHPWNQTDRDVPGVRFSLASPLHLQQPKEKSLGSGDDELNLAALLADSANRKAQMESGRAHNHPAGAR